MVVTAAVCNPRPNVGGGAAVAGFDPVEVRLNPPPAPAKACDTGELIDTPGGSTDGDVIALTSVVAEDV